MTYALVLGRRALREGMRTPEAIVPTLFIPLFFLVVNVGQAARIFPGSTTAFLHGQGYGAFQLPSSMLLAASFGSAALFLVEEIEGGYFDKLRATPVRRSAIVLGRLFAEGTKALLIASVIVVLGLAFGITIASGFLGFLLLIVLTSRIRWRSPPRSTRSRMSWRRCARSSSRISTGRRSASATSWFSSRVRSCWLSASV